MQPESLILLPIAIGLLVVLILVRRAMKPQSNLAERLAGESLHTLQDIHATLREIAGYLKPAPVEIALHAKLTDPAQRRAAQKVAEEVGRQARKVRAGAGRG